MGPAARPPALRVQLVSDLHADVADTGRLRPAPGADLVVVAGDTCAGAERAFAHLRARIPAPLPIVMVMGNHEYYGACLPDALARARAAAPGYGITLLENDAAVFGGVRVLGCTLWTDYGLFGAAHRALAMAAARRGLADHRAIAGRDGPAGPRFRPQDAAALHAASRAFLAEALARPFAGPTVVVTHHAPHALGIAPRFGRDPLSTCFASDLSALIRAAQPELWLFGHTHHPVDAWVGRTRLVANPHGYRAECAKTFDPALVLTLPSPTRPGARA